MLFRDPNSVEKVFKEGIEHSFEGFKVRCSKIRLKEDQEEVKNTKKATPKKQLNGHTTVSKFNTTLTIQNKNAQNDLNSKTKL